MTSADRGDARLPARAEALLSAWPVADKDEAEWEERARAIQKRLMESPPGSAADLLRPPFPSSSGEDGAEARRPSSPRLSDIARAVRESRPDHLADAARVARDSKPDDNLTEIAKASLSLASQARAAAPEMAARVRAAQSVRTPAETTPVPASAGGAGTPMQSIPRPAEASSRRAPVLALVAAGLALAAAVALLVRPRSETPTAQEAHEPAQAAPVASAPAAPAPIPVEPRVDVDDLPGLAADSKVAARAPRTTSGKVAAGKPEAASARERTSQVAQPPAAPKPQASSSAQAELKPADGRTGLPEKPSTGAVQAALGAVIGGARSCVSGQEHPSGATIVFGSDGRVQSVTVTGGAAGTPAAACIRSALEKARVHPFAKPTFSASVTIRPN